MSIFWNWAFLSLQFCHSAFMPIRTVWIFGGDFTPIAFGDYIGDPFVNLRIVNANLTRFYSSFGCTHKIVDILLKFFPKGCGNLYYTQDVFIIITLVGIVQRVTETRLSVTGPRQHTSRSTSRQF